jgi:tRNA nucleotidyltransferase/poly(A) polymerase
LLTGEGELLDPMGGLLDLRAKVLRAAGSAEERLLEDALRMLRAPRFAARFGLEIDDSLRLAIRRLAIRRHARRIGSVARERISGEILKMAALDGERFAAALEEMDSLDLLREVLPEVHALKGLPQSPEWHPEGDVFVHTLAALRCNESRDSELNLAILCHDLGKAKTYKLIDGRRTFHGHDQAGREIVARLAGRLGLKRALGDRLAFVAAEHMRAKLIGEMKPSKVQRLIDDPAWPLLKATTLCDCAAAGIAGRLACLEGEIEQAEKRAAVWRARQEKGSNYILSGAEIMRIAGLPPGSRIGELMRAVRDWALDNDIMDRDRWIEYVKSRARE